MGVSCLHSLPQGQEGKGMLGDGSWSYWEQMGRDGGVGTWGRQGVSLGVGEWWDYVREETGQTLPHLDPWGPEPIT